jgi:hypothetical protein
MLVASNRSSTTQPVESGWRVVLTITDEVGNRWPVAVRLDERGGPADGAG